jgi:hypothetical protein
MSVYRLTGMICEMGLRVTKDNTRNRSYYASSRRNEMAFVAITPLVNVYIPVYYNMPICTRPDDQRAAAHPPRPRQGRRSTPEAWRYIS